MHHIKYSAHFACYVFICVNKYIIIKHYEDRLLTTLQLSGAQMLATPAWKNTTTHNEAIRTI